MKDITHKIKGCVIDVRVSVRMAVMHIYGDDNIYLNQSEWINEMSMVPGAYELWEEIRTGKWTTIKA